MTGTSIHHVIGGGTFSHVRNHLALAAPAFGTTARSIHRELLRRGEISQLHLTRMADPRSSLVTTTDVARLTDQLTADANTKIVFFNPAITDFDGHIGVIESGPYAERLKSRNPHQHVIRLTPAAKIIGGIRKDRKDIYLVGFKTTCGADPDQQYIEGLRLLKEGHVNLVLANDTKTRMNMVIVPEEARYHETNDREAALKGLIDIALSRSDLTFTRSTVLQDQPRVKWAAPEIPENLRVVVDHLIARNAYKPFLGSTAGHFAARGFGAGEFLTSARKENYWNLQENGLVRVFAKGANEVVAHGAKPSVGGQSQRIVFDRYPELDCIVHFHAPLKADAASIPIQPQWMYECGSHQCGQNTADGLGEVGDGIYAVMLDNHGPNIVFSRNIEPEKVIALIERNWDLAKKTGGPIPKGYQSRLAL